MLTRMLKFLSPMLLVVACGTHPAASSDHSTPSPTSGSTGGTVEQNPQPAPPVDERAYPFNYPVMLCGEVSATSDNVATAEYVLKNGTIAVYLITTSATDALLVEQMHMLPGIFKYGGADGCVSGRNLPASENGRLTFVVEKGGISIASGGFSVSN